MRFWLLGLFLFTGQTLADDVKRYNVEVVAADKGKVTEWVFAEGVAQGVRREYLSFERAGKVMFIANDEDGKPLRAGSRVRGPGTGEKFGQLLARVDERQDLSTVEQAEAGVVIATRKVAQAKAGVTQAQNNLSLAQQEFARIESVWNKRTISKDRYDQSRTRLLNAKQGLRSSQAELEAAEGDQQRLIAQLNQAKLGLEKNSLFAPFDGVIRKMNIRKGDYYLGPEGGTNEESLEGSAAMVVVDTSQYEVTLDVPYFNAANIREGQSVYLAWSARDLSLAAKQAFTRGQFVKGRVHSVSPSISLRDRAVEVKVHTQTAPGLLRDGLLTTCWIATREANDSLVLPFNALIYRGDKVYVYVVDQAKGLVTRRELTLGIEGLGMAEVLSGLNEGELVVSKGQHLLSEGAPVAVVWGQK